MQTKYVIVVPTVGYIIPGKVIKFGKTVDQADKWKTIKGVLSHFNGIRRHHPNAKIHQLEFTVTETQLPDMLTYDEIDRHIESNSSFITICDIDYAVKRPRFLYRNGFDDANGIWSRNGKTLTFDKSTSTLTLGLD